MEPAGDNYRMVMLAKFSSSPEVLSQLANSNVELVRIEVAKNENFNDFDLLVKDPSPKVRIEVAKRANQKALAKLADDVFPDIRRIVAKRAKDPEVLVKFIKDSDWHVRLNAAWNENKDFFTAMELAKDPNPFVREAVAYTTKSKKILQMLSKDKERIVLSAVCENPHADEKILEKIVSRDPKMAEVVLSRKDITADLLSKIWDRTERSMELAAGNINTPSIALEKIYEKISKWKEVNVGLLVKLAKHPNTPPKVLYALSFYAYPEVRREVAKHKNTPIEILNKLAFDSDTLTKSFAINTMHQISDESIEEPNIAGKNGNTNSHIFRFFAFKEKSRE